ncbi:MBL fold metallo-hydrolase [Mesorhizobium sp. ASY16-5R]|uniref:MBL fold metallo-hydrolase n=1 Tax=Mesorhizobium sp. ASY16-5R TaxID=3445772 RepID=UPI003FA01DD1
MDTSTADFRRKVELVPKPPAGGMEGPVLHALKTNTVPDLTEILRRKAAIELGKDTTSDNAFRVKLWGTRGSIPVCGREFRRHGGNTPCVEMRCGDHTMIFDAGSGIRPAGLSVMQSGAKDVHLFFTHFHYDHVLGLPFFSPLWVPSINVQVWSGLGTISTHEMLHELMRAPWFPVSISICQATLATRDFKSGDVLKPWPDVTIRTANLNHPGGCVGYRVEFGGRAVALISDTEHVEGELDKNILGLIDKADLVIYDATYTEAEMVKKRGWGHSTWQEGVKLCKAAGAKKLALFHHDPFRTDAALDALQAEAKAVFPGAFAARDGQTITMKIRQGAAKRA